jgi:hypothetical protein
MEGEGRADGDARGLFLDGPYLYVASGAGGLRIFDVLDRDDPRLLSILDLDDPELPDDANAVSVMFQYSRPNPAGLEAPRSQARSLAAVANGRYGVVLVDTTRPQRPVVIGRIGGTAGAVDAALGTIYEIGSEGGGIRSAEKDFVFTLTGNALLITDVTRPDHPTGLNETRRVGVPGGGRALKFMRAYNPPFLQAFVLVSGAAGPRIVDVSNPSQPTLKAAVNLPGTLFVDVEEFPLDRMIDFQAKPLKDISHEDARYLSLEEIRKVLGVPVRQR